LLFKELKISAKFKQLKQLIGDSDWIATKQMGTFEHRDLLRFPFCLFVYKNDIKSTGSVMMSNRLF
jgi:hypothetical protein